jgi:dTDP-4-amino-4,6-dideoxygalactose transaminase
MIPFLDLKQINTRFENEFKTLFSGFLNSGSYILGDAVSNFETAFANYCGTKYSVGVSNGLDALILIFKAYKALGVLKDGDEVIVPSNTYIASVLAIINSGLKPVFVEPNPKTFNIEAEAIQLKITKKTKAILVVHLYGQLCKMEDINKLAKPLDILVVEDAAQAHGAQTKEFIRAGNLSDAAGFSFYPSKNLGALGDAGAITTNNAELYHLLLKLRNYGSSKKYENEVAGFNNRIDPIQAKFLSYKLEFLDEDNAVRRVIAEEYLEGIINKVITLPFYDSSLNHVFHLFVILVPNRTHFMNYMLGNNIQTAVHYPVPPHHQVALQQFSHLDLPIAENIHNTCVSLPVSPVQTKEQTQKIIETINSYNES